MVLPLTFRPEAMFKIRPVTRASSTLEGHSEAILQVAFSPDGTKLASASGDTTVRLWNLGTESPDKTCEGHKKFITSIAWEPLIRMSEQRRLASSSKDMTVRIWATANNSCLLTLGCHTASVTKVLWGGEGIVYSAS